ncbi:hypothetical protein [Shewanella sp. SR44-3]|uniref:hypothetical protein n=1 Tax=unclassified Shewanella TaxID=196818 RepID=UPI0015FC0C08|nr:hypothetical protein [Shewanella sp. SR44-3]MBB1268910.1 hypothetical protein [Shewanella sp. SR44-3]
MKIRAMIVFFTVFIVGCSTISNALNFVPTFNSNNNVGKEDWPVVKVVHDGSGFSNVYAYKRSANPAQKIAASHINNRHSDALLFPNEENFIVLTYKNGSRIGTTIFNGVKGEKNSIYTIYVTGEESKFKTRFVDEKGNNVQHEITVTP